ncbi:transposase [Delftia sp. GW456-R20]|uniref:transposase n=1 Tax=Delftia sp. GW456-R20 TaxID=1827145 RepID=UPI001E410BAE|nr:transposase [Delftia sp. GW456-R20]
MCQHFVPSAKGGAPKLAVSDEAALTGILFVLQTGIPWEDLPQSLGYGSGMTCWWRLRDWNAACVWVQLHQAMLTRLCVHKQIDKRCRAHLRQRVIASRIARRGVESSEGLGKNRWVVERTHGWFAGFGKLRIRFERRLDIHEALLKLAAAHICARFVDRWC